MTNLPRPFLAGEITSFPNALSTFLFIGAHKLAILLHNKMRYWKNAKSEVEKVTISPIRKGQGRLVIKTFFEALE